MLYLHYLTFVVRAIQVVATLLGVFAHSLDNVRVTDHAMSANDELRL